jgi:phospholipase D3/4
LIFSDWNLGPKKDASIRKLARIENIEIKISSIPINSKGFIAFSRVEHLKYLTGDGDKSFISTSNWGYDYFYNTRGAALLIDGLSAAKILEDIFDRDWNSPYVFAFDPKAKYENKRKE